MPRTGGIYTPPAGTKATPNTTVQSAPYNAFVDDLAADANAARPVTAGGTGATNETAARAAIGADNASNLTQGTVADARLPATMSAKTFSGLVTAAADLKVGDGVRVNPTIGIYGPVNTDRVIRAFTGNTVVSELALADFTAQPGGNVGANITFRTYSDAGVFLKNAMTIFRDYGIAAFTAPLRIASYTLLTIPLAGLSAQCIVYVSNGAGNKRLAISDGTNWYWPDGSVIS